MAAVWVTTGLPVVLSHQRVTIAYVGPLSDIQGGKGSLKKGD